MAVLHVAHDDELVEESFQTVADDVIGDGGLCAGTFGDDAVLIDGTVIASCLDTLVGRLARVIVELDDGWSFHTRGVLHLAIEYRVDVPQHGVVGGQQEAVTGVHGEEVGEEVELVDGPVDDVHR